MSPPPSSPTTRKVVYTVIERGGRSVWRAIGAAFVNRDGSWNVKLDALPVNGTLQIRDAPPQESESAEAAVPRPVPHVSDIPVA